MRITVINSILHVVVENDEELQYIQKYEVPKGEVVKRKYRKKSERLADKPKVNKKGFPCPDCDFSGKGPQGLGVHRSQMHGYVALTYQENKKYREKLKLEEEEKQRHEESAHI